MSEVRDPSQQISVGSTVEFAVIYNQRSGALMLCLNKKIRYRFFISARSVVTNLRDDAIICRACYCGYRFFISFLSRQVLGVAGAFGWIGAQTTAARTPEAAQHLWLVSRAHCDRDKAAAGTNWKLGGKLLVLFKGNSVYLSFASVFSACKMRFVSNLTLWFVNLKNWTFITSLCSEPSGCCVYVQHSSPPQ